MTSTVSNRQCESKRLSHDLRHQRAAGEDDTYARTREAVQARAGNLQQKRVLAKLPKRQLRTRRSPADARWPTRLEAVHVETALSLFIPLKHGEETHPRLSGER
jgi:hypothetical protein